MIDYEALVYRAHELANLKVENALTEGRLERVTLPGGEVLAAHPAKDCAGRHCSVHNPSSHSMIGFPQHWRGDRGLMERLCSHGVGHPDPDDINFKRGKYGPSMANAEAIHGCDGCCHA